MKVLLAFDLTATATGAAVGLVAGGAWELAGLPRAGVVAAAAVVVAALSADVFRIPVLCTRRQVPREWGRLLPPVTVAVLYGARLGVGPLTILNSWLWWTGLLLGASHGLLAGFLAGALFGSLRALLTAAAGVRRAVPRPAE